MIGLVELAVVVVGSIISAMAFAIFQERMHRQEIGRAKADLLMRIKFAEDERDDAIKRVQEQARREREAFQAEIRDLRAQMAGVLSLVSAHDGRGLPQPDQAHLVVYGRLMNEFSMDEIRALAFKLGFNSDNMRGDTQSELAESLTKAMMNRGRLRELLDLIQQERP